MEDANCDLQISNNLKIGGRKFRPPILIFKVITNRDKFNLIYNFT
jgi:hypothetical protein